MCGLRFRYERLPNFCFRCGLIGHEQKGCSAVKDTEEEEPPFGSWLKTSPLKLMEELLVLVAPGWCEVEVWERVPARRLDFSEASGSDNNARSSGMSTPGGRNGLNREEDLFQSLVVPRGKEDQEVRSGLRKQKLLTVEDSGKNRVSLSPKAQSILPIGSPMKKFLSLTPRGKGKPSSPTVAAKLDGNMKISGGRSGPVVALSIEVEAHVGGIAPSFPSSPISNMLISLI